MIWFPIAFATIWLGVLAYQVRKLRSRQATAAGILIAYGALGFFSFFITNSSDVIVPTSVELPNAAPRAGVAIDSHGNIYVGSEPLGRVQKYDRSGKFFFAVSPETQGGIFRLRVAEDDRLHVISVRSRSEQVYSPDGVLLETLPFNMKNPLGDQSLSTTRDGISVRADWAFIIPRIVIVSQGTYRWLLPNIALFSVFSPIHGWLLVAMGMLWIAALKARRGDFDPKASAAVIS